MLYLLCILLLLGFYMGYQDDRMEKIEKLREQKLGARIFYA
jgi:uncharacterized membrane protein